MDETSSKAMKEIEEWETKNGLPKLVGTAKQIEWAREIRYNTRLMGGASKSKYGQKRREAVEYMIHKCTNAAEWISGRESRGRDGKLMAGIEMVRDWAAKKEEGDHGVDYTSEEFARYPDECSKPGTVEISASDDIVTAKYIKDDDFRQIVKNKGFRWDSQTSEWYRKINKFSGPAGDRAAELGNMLLRAGFGIRCKDIEILNAATEANYEPEQDKWVTLIAEGEYKGWLAISVPTDDLYKAARRLPESRWSKPKVVVGINYYKEVLDFADLNGYSVSDGAKAAISAEKENRDIVKPKRRKVSDANAEDKLKAILEQGDDIIEDLRDED